MNYLGSQRRFTKPAGRTPQIAPNTIHTSLDTTVNQRAISEPNGANNGANNSG